MVYALNGSVLSYAEMYQRLADITHAQKGVDIVREDLTTSKLSCITRFFWKILCCTCLRNFFFKSDLSKIRNTVRNLNIGPMDPLFQVYQAAVTRLDTWSGIAPQPIQQNHMPLQQHYMPVQQQLHVYHAPVQHHVPIPQSMPIQYHQRPLRNHVENGVEYVAAGYLPDAEMGRGAAANPRRSIQRPARSAAASSRASTRVSRESPTAVHVSNVPNRSARRDSPSHEPVPIARASDASNNRLSAGGGSVKNVQVGRGKDR